MMIMIAKKTLSMDALIDLAMTKLFQLAEYVCDKTAMERVESDACINSCEREDFVPTIRFSKEDRMVEGELFK